MSKLNPQKATAYVGPGVLRKGGKITPVPNGPLIKKKGSYAGSTLKKGGPIKKAQVGIYQPMNPRTKFKTRSEDGNYKLKLKGDKLVERRTLKGFFSGAPRAQGKMDLNGDNVKLLKSLRSITNANDPSSSKDKDKDKDGVKSNDGSWDSIRPKYPTPFKFAKINKNGGPIKKAKAGAMIKRADGSMSKRGLWDNIRANKGSGKKPTKQMLVQEKKIKAKSKK